MSEEERADAFGAEIARPAVIGPGHYNRVGEDAGGRVSRSVRLWPGLQGGVEESYALSAIIPAALEVTQQELAARVMVGEVTQRLHRLAPHISCYWRPPGVRIELLVVLDERLDQRLLPARRVLPDLGRVQDDVAVDDVRRVPLVDDALGALDDVELLAEVVVLEDGAGLELLRDAGLPGSRAMGVAAETDALARAGGVERGVDDGLGRVVGS